MSLGNFTRTITLAPRDRKGTPNTEVQIDKDQKGKTIMIAIRKSTCPIPTRGRSASSEPTVRISAGGQLAFNSTIIKALDAKSKKFLNVGFDEASRKLTLQVLAAAPKGVKEDDLFGLTTKDENVYSAFSMVFNHESVGYDYKSSGNQSFVATVDPAKSVVSFVLPKSLPAKPSTPRKPKAPKAQAATATGSTVANPANDELEELLD